SPSKVMAGALTCGALNLPSRAPPIRQHPRRNWQQRGRLNRTFSTLAAAKRGCGWSDGGVPNGHALDCGEVALGVSGDRSDARDVDRYPAY
ncbi:hypothetical protein M3B38_04260, partial [Dietzia cinnamea]|uniref:hypothetical protein n=1 Tax=Dietzia cinnamea TaxID=321318 RepID=UPI0021A74E5E